MNIKQLKDPIYGYIEIDESIMHDIVDSSTFQRLRRIRQTGYSPLYHASMHNRFIHSIGVYFLSKFVCKTLGRYIDLEFGFDVKNIFSLACLLHDVGHAPFSHSGEKFFLSSIDKSDDQPHIYKMLIDSVNDLDFHEDVNFYHNGIVEHAAPHEIMSVLISLKKFGNYINTIEEKVFFARCITGYKYRTKLTKHKRFLNCFIEMLNSKVIDVDKLDYIIRDSFITGFQSVSIDYERLLNGLMVIEDEDGYHLAYHKSALSIIENVIYAHDSERKWIQNHPVVLYEDYLHYQTSLVYNLYNLFLQD